MGRPKVLEIDASYFFFLVNIIDCIFRRLFGVVVVGICTFAEKINLIKEKKFQFHLMFNSKYPNV